MRPSRFVAALFLTLGGFVVCPVPAKCARLLAIVTVPSRSRWNVMSAVLEALTDVGHQVTVFTPFPGGNRENYTEIDTSNTAPVNVAKNFTEVRSLFRNVWTLETTIIAQDRHFCDVLHNRLLKDLLAGAGLRDRFDAILVEPRKYDCLTHIAADRDLPLIFVYPMPALHGKEYEWIGTASNPATTSSLAWDRAVPRTFAQRFSNAIATLRSNVVSRTVELYYRTTDPRPYDSHASVPPSLVCMNRHFVSDTSRPIPPNVISIGGIHLKPSRKIPNDILQFIEDSPHGVVLFSFGSVISMDSMPQNVQKAFIDGLAQLPQNVLLKYEGELKDRPTNIMTRKWLPQRDILLHPKVKLFISHGGISGTYEAVDAGVPVLGFPLFLDQYRNIDFLGEAGMAISMEILTVTKHEFVNNVLELINDEKYMKNAKSVSSVFRDRPLSPKQSVVYWTEYVIRHKGAPHLKPYGIHLSWYQYFLLDVLCAMLILIVITLFFLYKLIHFFKILLTTFAHTVKKTKSE